MRFRRDVLSIDAACWGGTILAGALAWIWSGTVVVPSVTAVVVMLAALSPTGALYGSLAAVPLVFHPIVFASMQFSLLELGIVATSTGWIIHLAYEALARGATPQLDWLQPYWTLALPMALVSIGTLSLVTMPFDLHRAEAVRTWRWVVLEPVALFVLCRWAIARDGFRNLAIAMVFPGVAVAIAALVEFGRYSSAYAVDAVRRSTATYLHPNNLALYLERVLFLAIAPAVAQGTQRRKWWLAGTVLVGAGLVTTYSRGAMLGLLAGFVVVLATIPVRHGWKLLASIALAGSAGFVLLAPERLTGASSSGVADTRRHLWTASLDMLRDFPATGIGLDQFLWLHSQRYIRPEIWAERYVSHPHNLVLDAWLSLGILGVTLLAIGIALGTATVVKARRGQIRWSVWQAGAMASLAAGLAHGMVDNGYFLPDLAAMTWVSIAIVIGISCPDRRTYS